MTKGWFFENIRHSLAGKGIKTKIPKSAILTAKAKKGTSYEIEKDMTPRTITEPLYYLKIYDKETGDLMNEIPLGSKIPEQYKKVKVKETRRDYGENI